MKNIINKFFGLGNLPFAASLVSLVALGFYLLLNLFAYSLILNLFVFGIFLIAGFVDLYINRTYAANDPKEIIIDEFLGMYTLLLIANEKSILINIIFFILFRTIDIFKPFPFSIIDRKMKTWFGVLFDDVAIGIFIALLFLALKLVL